MRWKKPLYIVILAGVVLTIAASMAGGFFGSISVCSDCGRTKYNSRRYWISRARIEETTLSRVHDTLMGGKEHEHHWLFAHGGGGQITCAIGEGRRLFPAVRREDLREALELIRKNRGDEATKLWMRRLLDPKSSRDASYALGVLTSDSRTFEEGYKDAEENFASMSAS